MRSLIDSGGKVFQKGTHCFCFLPFLLWGTPLLLNHMFTPQCCRRTADVSANGLSGIWADVCTTRTEILRRRFFETLTLKLIQEVLVLYSVDHFANKMSEIRKETLNKCQMSKKNVSYVELIIINHREKHQILTFKKLEPADIWHLCLSDMIK